MRSWVHPLAQDESYPQRVNWRLTIPMSAVVLVIWLVGSVVTKYSLGQMAVLAPVAVVVVGAQIGLVMLWVKIVRESMRQRRARRDAAA